MSKLTDLIRPFVILQGVTGYTGGGATKIDGLATVGQSVPLTAFATIGGLVHFYQLRAGTDAESSPDIIRPDDHATTTNEKVWELLGVSAGGSGSSFVAKSGDTMTGLLTLSGDPSSALHAATKQYVDAISAGLDPKGSCRAATTGNISLSGEQTIDGVSVVAGDRVLVKAQSAGADNGIYVASAGSWSRATDADTNAEVTAGLFVFVTEGTVNADTAWLLTTNDPITLGSTSLSFQRFSVPLADGEVTDAKIGNRTVDDTLGSPSSTGALTSLLSWISGRLKAITGKASWLTAPAITLEDTNTALVNLKKVSIPFVIDGGGAVITTGNKGAIRVPAGMTLTGWQVFADQSGSVVVDVKRATYADLPTTASIAASAKPTLSAAQKNQDLTLTGWTTTIAEGDWLEFVVDSAATVTRVTVALIGTRT